MNSPQLRPQETGEGSGATLGSSWTFPASLYDGVSPRPRSGTVTIDEERLTLEIEGTKGSIAIRPEHIVGEFKVHDEVHLELSPPTEDLASLKLVVKHPDFDRALAAHLSRVDLRAGASLRRTLGRIPLWGWVLLALFVVPSMYFLLTWGVVALHVFVSIEDEVALGEAVYNHLVESFKVCDDAALQKELQDMVDELVEPDSPFECRVTVFDSPIVNAIALPGGRIVIFSGLLRDSSPGGVMGVLAHEVAHVERRHGLKQLIRTMGVMFFMGAAVGGGFEELELAESAAELAGALVVLKYSRSSEAEADEIAVRKLHADRRSVAGLIEFFERLDRKRGLRGVEEALLWLSSHPLTARRIEALRSARAAESFEPAPWRIGREEWNELVRACPGAKDPREKDARDEALEEPPNEPREKR